MGKLYVAYDSNNLNIFGLTKTPLSKSSIEIKHTFCYNNHAFKFIYFLGFFADLFYVLEHIQLVNNCVNTQLEVWYFSIETFRRNFISHGTTKITAYCSRGRKSITLTR